MQSHLIENQRLALLATTALVLNKARDVQAPPDFQLPESRLIGEPQSVAVNGLVPQANGRNVGGQKGGFR